MPRFRNEIRFLEGRRNYAGVLPMLDYALPQDPAEPSWYVMPIATPILKALGKTPEFFKVVEAMAYIAHTLARLATEGVEGHRDLKPGNLFALNDEWVIGDFGLVKYPEREAVTKHGRALGPADFMAPEMRRDADTGDAGLADVYSLAKALWSIATGEKYPPPGELRSDRHALRLSSYVDDRRAALLEPLLERCTSHEPTDRPTMPELAEEMTWWSAPVSVPVQVDLSKYVPEVNRLREANRVVKEESRHERLARVYNDVQMSVHSRLQLPLTAAVEVSGLRNLGSVSDYFQGWFPYGYGGSAGVPCWGIDTLRWPRLAASVGTVHRSKPAEDLEELGIAVMIVILTEDSLRICLREFETFHSGSLLFNSMIDRFEAKINSELPAIVMDFLTVCRDTGIPQLSSGAAG